MAPLFKTLEAPIVGVRCSKCGAESTTIVPIRMSESYDYESGIYTFIDATECGGCGHIVFVERRMKIVEQRSMDIIEGKKEE